MTGRTVDDNRIHPQENAIVDYSVKVMPALGLYTTSHDMTADIDLTIAHWEITSVDYCDAWWAIGRRYPCAGGWAQVRNAMIRLAKSEADRSITKRAA